MNMNNESVDEGYRNMISCFGCNELHTQLGAFRQNIAGQKSKLKDRAIELLRTRPANINYSAYIAKINKIYRSLQNGMPCHYISMSSLIQNQQQQQQRQMVSSMGHIQNSPQRIYQQPQYPQQSIHMTRAGLPKLLPIVQRGTYGNHVSNSIPTNNMVSNNIQYIAAGNNQSSGTRTIVSHQLPPNQQIMYLQ